MKKRKNSRIVLFVFCLQFTLVTIFAQQTNSKFKKIKEVEGIEEYLYEPNGLGILLKQDNTVPVVTVQVVYKVGSRHEVPGNTGSAHLLEHLMFKGTEKMNKETGRTITGELQKVGAQMNATTWSDGTSYYETIPSDKIELALEIEADRMRNSRLLKKDKEAEMTVVRNEFEQDENNPSSLLNKEIWAAAYMAQSYHHSTIGWKSDIENMPIEVLRNFYNTYYWPENAVLTVVGDFEKVSLFSMIAKHFGKISKSPSPIQQPYTKEPRQSGPRMVTVKRPGQTGMVSVGFKIPGATHKDMPALKVLGDILSKGPSAILNKDLVDKGLAFYTFAEPSSFKETNLFMTALRFSADKNHDEMKIKLLEALDKVKKEGVEQSEVDRIISKRNTKAIFTKDGSGRISGELAKGIAIGDWTDYVQSSKNLSKVTAKDVQRVANIYITEDQSTTGYFIPQLSRGNGSGSKKGKLNFQAPKNQFNYENPNFNDEISLNFAELAPHAMPINFSRKKNNIMREKIAGIDVITATTGVKDFVFIAGSFPISAYRNSNANQMVPTLTLKMLTSGTKNIGKIEFNQKLDKMGIELRTSPESHFLSFYFRCLKKDIPEAMALMAEAFRIPLLDVNELEIEKKKVIGGMQRRLNDPSSKGKNAMLQYMYPEDHPNYAESTETLIKLTESVTANEVKEFHENYFGPAGMNLIILGDFDRANLNPVIKKTFNGWKGGSTIKGTYNKSFSHKKHIEVVTIPQKPSASLIIGQYTGLKEDDANYMPFYLANSVLGFNFSGRLMKTVRDEEGLTYGIGSSHEGHSLTGGHWFIIGEFAPELFQRGEEATLEQLKLWYDDGITAEELETIKTSLQGTYKVGMSRTLGVGATLLRLAQRGKSLEYFYQYPDDIEKVTLEQANSAIKKYIDLDKLVIIKAGSLNDLGKPIKD